MTCGIGSESFFWQLLRAETYRHGMEGFRELSEPRQSHLGAPEDPRPPWHAASAVSKLMASHPPCHPPLALCLLLSLPPAHHFAMGTSFSL